MFVPKNIDKRACDLKRIQAKELQDYEDFVKEFSKNLTAIQDKKFINEKEQLFIDLIQECEIKTDQQKDPFRIYLFKDDEFMFEYDWKNDILYCSNDRVWSVFVSKFNMSYETWKRFIADQVETHFNFRPSTTISIYKELRIRVETHFKFRLSIN